MCGIAGLISENTISDARHKVEKAIERLHHRGPDFSSVKEMGTLCLGHARLSIIDTSEAGNQPMSDLQGRATVVFNGEIYNYKALRKDLEAAGYAFRSHTDTEVLLNAYLHYGDSFLDRLNGFFAFALYDHRSGELLLARDRFGIKPLYYHHHEGFLAFASEQKGLRAMVGTSQVNPVAMHLYFRLNYIPAPLSIYRDSRQLLPGEALRYSKGKLEKRMWYRPEEKLTLAEKPIDYESAKKKLVDLLEEAVAARLVADVPLGAFLSGGIDSSVVVALASRHTEKLHTFSLGFEDAPFFDESAFARLTAKKFNTVHTAFKLRLNDLYSELEEVLSFLDEPFADSSAVLVYALSKETRKYVTVALSGDGGDELFAGYHKHYGEQMMRSGNWKMQAVAALGPLWKMLPRSRSGRFGNTVRQLDRFARGARLSATDRYWQWCSIAGNEENSRLMKEGLSPSERAEMEQIVTSYTAGLHDDGELNEVLLADLKLVLPGDMLTKVDRMSMANSLEVRVPFLDHRVVEYAFSLEPAYKISGKDKKKIVRDAFREVLPAALFDRPKRGFEVPMLEWMRGPLKERLFNDLLSESHIRTQGLFNYEEILRLRRQLFSVRPGDAPARLYALLVFQTWWRKHFNGT